jgi:hypothetical protein
VFLSVDSFFYDFGEEFRKLTVSAVKEILENCSILVPTPPPNPPTRSQVCKRYPMLKLMLSSPGC